ncbi:MAG: protein GlmU [Desulfobacterales bacterium]|nr:protein GlmU [Desulfobacterales bacterium]
MPHSKKSKVYQLLDKGVRIASPESIEIGEDVKVENISADGVVLHAGSKIFGSSTLISRDTKIGHESPATVKQCQIGPGVELKGGYFEGAVFLAKAKAGSGAHVREASIFEEQASVAHTVGTKHTILFPFVTLGSLINFCDCLMAGGTSRKNHSEVGSSYIHFNFTPKQDKATASLIGDVPRGVLLNQPPIFLGGQGGMVGPCRLAFGTTVAAGTIVRKDELRSGRLIFGAAPPQGNMPYQPHQYGNLRRVVMNNIMYIANLIALNQWYRHVRSQFMSNRFPEMLLAGLNEKMDWAISERIERLEGLWHTPNKQPAESGSASDTETFAAAKQQQELIAHGRQLKDFLEQSKTVSGHNSCRDAFLEAVLKGIQQKGPDYIPVIQQLSPSDGKLATAWLQGIIDHIVKDALDIMPSFK